MEIDTATLRADRTAKPSSESAARTTSAVERCRTFSPSRLVMEVKSVRTRSLSENCPSADATQQPQLSTAALRYAAITHSRHESCSSDDTVELNAAATCATPDEFVVVVDDERVVRAVTGRLVGKLGFGAVYATDGDEVETALEQLKATGKEPVCVLMDIVMKRVDGETACRRLRRAGYAFPIVAATANASSADRARYLEAGFNTVLTKPFSIRELKQVISQVRVMAQQSQ